MPNPQAISRKTYLAACLEATALTPAAAPQIYVPTKSIMKGVQRFEYLSEERNTRDENNDRVPTTREGDTAPKGSWYNDAHALFLWALLGQPIVSQPDATHVPTVYKHTIQIQDIPPTLSLWKSYHNVIYRSAGGAVKKLAFKFNGHDKSLECDADICHIFPVKYAGVANPTVQAAGTSTTTGGSLAAGNYTIAYQYITLTGATQVSPASAAIATTGTTSVINTTALGALPAGVTGVQWWIITAPSGNVGPVGPVQASGGTYTITAQPATNTTPPTVNSTAILAPSFSSVKPFAGYKPTLTFSAGVSSDVSELSIDIEQNVAPWFPANGNPDFSRMDYGARKATISGTVRFDIDTFYNNFLNVVDDSLTIDFQGQLIANSGGTGTPPNVNYYQELNLAFGLIGYDSMEHDTGKDNVLVKFKATARPTGGNLLTGFVQNTIPVYTPA